MNLGSVIVENAMRDLAHDSIHNRNQKQADSREISGCLPSYSGKAGGGDSILQNDGRPDTPSVRVTDELPSRPAAGKTSTPL